MATLVCRQFCWQGVLLKAGADLSRWYNAASGIGCKPLLTGPNAHRCRVIALAKGTAITYTRCLPAARAPVLITAPQSSHIPHQRLLAYVNISAQIQEHPHIMEAKYDAGFKRNSGTRFWSLHRWALLWHALRGHGGRSYSN